MQFKFFAVVFTVCLTTFVSASPVPVVAPAAIQAREIVDELNDEVAREPEPVCAKYQCF